MIHLKRLVLRSLIAGDAQRKLRSVWNRGTVVCAAVVALAWGCGGRASETSEPPRGPDGGSPDAIALDDGGSDSAACPSGNGGFPDAGGGPTQSAAFFGPLGQMVLDGHDVVLTSGGASAENLYGALIRTMPGGGGVTVLVSGTPGAWIGAALAADAQHFYFSTQTRVNGPGSVFALDRAGGAPVKLADTQGPVLGFAVDATRLYWAEQSASTTPSGAIRAVALPCGQPVVLAANQVVGGALAVDASRIYWSIVTFSQDDAGAHLVQGAILAMPLAGGAPTTLATDPYVPYAMAVDGASLFWADAASGGIDCLPPGRIVAFSGASQPVILASNLFGPVGFALSSDAVYFSEMGAVCTGPSTGLGSVAKVSRAGGPIVSLASQVTSPGPLVLDGANLDFADEASPGGPGAVVAVGKLTARSPGVRSGL